MSERDPFGREKGEDALAELGWRTPAPSPQEADGAPVEEAAGPRISRAREAPA